MAFYVKEDLNSKNSLVEALRVRVQKLEQENDDLERHDRISEATTQATLAREFDHHLSISHPIPILILNS